MRRAMFFGLDDRGPALGRHVGTQARPGDPAADDHDIEFAHLLARLRIRKARRLGLGAMFNGAFTEALLIGLAAILVVAAVVDVRTFTISNRLSLAPGAGRAGRRFRTGVRWHSAVSLCLARYSRDGFLTILPDV